MEQKTRVGKCFIIYANRMIYLSCCICNCNCCLFGKLSLWSFLVTVLSLFGTLNLRKAINCTLCHRNAGSYII
jgi:hypothetical protein